MRLVLLGPPGAGKGTQGQALAARLGVPHVATGDLIRDHIARRTEFGCKVEAAIAEGNFASDEDILYWVSRRLKETDARSGYILDGFPRDLAQARAFPHPLDLVFWLGMDDEALIGRMAGRLVCPVCGTVYHVAYRPPRLNGCCDREGACLVRRPEDAPEKLHYRLVLNESQMGPLEPYYDAAGLMVHVDAVGTPEEVTSRILDVLSARHLANPVF